MGLVHSILDPAPLSLSDLGGAPAGPKLYVNQDGTGDYSTIQAAPDANERRATLPLRQPRLRGR